MIEKERADVLFWKILLEADLDRHIGVQLMATKVYRLTTYAEGTVDAAETVCTHTVSGRVTHLKNSRSA